MFTRLILGSIFVATFWLLDSSVHAQFPPSESGQGLYFLLPDDTPEDKPASAGPVPSDCRLHLDIPLTPQPNVPFMFDVNLESAAGASFEGVVPVFMEKVEAVSYEPSQFSARLNQRHVVRATIRETASGLVDIGVQTNGCGAGHITLSTGFRATLRFTGEPTLTGGEVRSETFELVDRIGNRVAMDSPATLSLSGSNLQLRALGSSEWQTELSVPLGRGVSSATVEMQAVSRTGGRGTVAAQIVINQGVPPAERVVLNSSREFTLVHPWWLAVLAAILGGILSSVIRLLTRQIRRVQRWMVQVALGACAGLVGYVLADLQVLGLTVDPTSLRGFVVIGFLMSFVGVSTALEGWLGANGRVKKTEPRPRSEGV